MGAVCPRNRWYFIIGPTCTSPLSLQFTRRNSSLPLKLPTHTRTTECQTMALKPAEHVQEGGCVYAFALLPGLRGHEPPLCAGPLSRQRCRGLFNGQLKCKAVLWGEGQLKLPCCKGKWRHLQETEQACGALSSKQTRAMLSAWEWTPTHLAFSIQEQQQHPSSSARSQERACDVSARRWLLTHGSR
ncbi:hypothetical protein AOLI_G00143410 [Acnodon oligacanthus]